MRVTNSMMSSTVLFNTQRALQRFVDLQTQMTSGRRINKPSDDPSGTLRDLGYRTEIADIEQYQKNVNRAQSWVKTYDDITADMKDVMSSVKEIAIAMSNGNFDAVARTGSATEVESAIDHFLQLGNTRLENRYVFAGNRTQTQPFSRSSNGFVYAGDFEQIEYEVSGKLRQPVNITGGDLLLKPLITLGRDTDLNNAVTPATLLANLNAGRGIGQIPSTFIVTDQNLNINVTVNLAGAVTVADALTAISAQLVAGGITNAVASIAPTGNSIKIDTTPNGLVNGTTLVSKINSGNGADLVPGKVRVSNGAGIDVEVDLSGSVTLSDIITKFNSTMTTAGVSNVVMTVDPSGTALRVADTNGVPLGLSITEISNAETTAGDLGIMGGVSPTLIGRALSPAVAFNIVETTGTVAHDLGVFGSFASDFIGSDIDPRLTLTSNVSELQNGLGSSLGPIELTHGGTRVTLNLSDPMIVTVQDLLNTFNNSGLNITASINSSGRGIQIVNNDNAKSFTIEESGGRTAKNLGIYGSSDMIGTLYVLTNALRNNDQEGAGLQLGHLDTSIQHLLDSRAEVGSRGVRLNTLSSRQDDQKLLATKRLSEIEDADIAELMMQIATHESSYQAALAAAAKIIQPSLMDFLKL